MISQADFSALASLDLDPIKVKLMHKESGEGWSFEQASAVETEYRRFLYLMKDFPNELAAPRFDVDIFWHYHILDTVKYAQDCEAIFGYFLHHFPYLGLRGEEDMEMHHQVGERMRELYEATFGEPYVRAAALPPAASTGSIDGTGKSMLAPVTAATAFPVRATVSVTATDTAFSVRSPAATTGAQTAFSVRTPCPLDAGRSAVSVRAPAGTASAGTAFSVRAPALTSSQTAFSVRAPAPAGSGPAFSVRAPISLAATQVTSSPSAAGSAPAAPAGQIHVGGSASSDHNHSIAAFYPIRPHLDAAGAPQWAQ